jgi:hypothetical protein
MGQQPQTSQQLEVKSCFFYHIMIVFIAQARNFISAFLLLSGGTLIATIIVLVENVYARFVARSKRANKKHENIQVEKSILYFEVYLSFFLLILFIRSRIVWNSNL